MTDYKAIADRLLERLGEDFISSWTDHRGKVYQLSGMGEPATSAEDICHDWRVAGRCMEDYLSREFTDWDDLRTYGEPLALHVILTYLDNTKNG